MKNILFVSVFTLFSIVGAMAQDRILRADSTVVEAKVLEVNSSEVRYRRFSNLDGPIYVLPLSEVRSILYLNGERDDFTPQAAVPHAEVEKAVSPQPANERRYVVGDYYDRDGVRGIVVSVSDEGIHGLILSLDEVNMAWTTIREPSLVGLNSNTDGVANMQALERYIADKKLSWSHFPAFKWCRDKGEGWYLPAIDEMLLVCANYNGGTRAANNSSDRARFNKTLKTFGGQRMNRVAFYISSTERDKASEIYTHVGLIPPYVGDIAKTSKFMVRALKRF